MIRSAFLGAIVLAAIGVTAACGSSDDDDDGDDSFQGPTGGVKGNEVARGTVGETVVEDACTKCEAAPPDCYPGDTKGEYCGAFTCDDAGAWQLTDDPACDDENEGAGDCDDAGPPGPDCACLVVQGEDTWLCGGARDAGGSCYFGDTKGDDCTTCSCPNGAWDCTSVADCDNFRAGTCENQAPPGPDCACVTTSTFDTWRCADAGARDAGL